MIAAVALVVVLSVVAAHHIGVIGQRSGCQRFRRRIRFTGHAAIQLYACRRKRRLGAAANTAADQCVHVQCAQNSCQCAVAAAVGIYHLCGSKAETISSATEVTGPADAPIAINKHSINSTQSQKENTS